MTIALDLSQQRKETAEAWFQSLQQRIFKAFEALEDDAPGPFAPGTFSFGKSSSQSMASPEAMKPFGEVRS